MAGRRDENGNNRSGVSWKVLLGILSLAVAVVVGTVAFLGGQAAAQSDLRQRVNQLEQDRATILEKLCHIEKSQNRIERKLFDGEGL